MAQTLEAVDGVIKASAEYKTKTATVKAAGKTCSLAGQESLIEALQDAGYDGKIVQKK